ncbi:MAG TPA: sugar phosphate isomerase/epimerase [Vicinamibacterales bacterium]|nr:sugar phosphate isomerase/epimerase [Vicinamibacterales bacterium]
MADLTRREWARLTAGAIAATAFSSGRELWAVPDSRIRGVRIGAQSYSFRDRPLDRAIEGYVAAGIGGCELWSGHVEPAELARAAGRDAAGREALRKWRLETPLEYFREIRAKFDRAGVELTAYNISFRDYYGPPPVPPGMAWTDEEIDRAFEMAKALGVATITSSATVSLAPRIDRAARRHGVLVGMHNHSWKRPDEFFGPEDWARALEGTSHIRINLDIGHFTAANFDAVTYLREHHDRIVSLHIKDRRRNDGPNVPFGEGDTPIAGVLRLLRDRKSPIPANIEYEYQGGDTIAEVRRCLEYCRKVLET